MSSEISVMERKGSVGQCLRLDNWALGVAIVRTLHWGDCNLWGSLFSKDIIPDLSNEKREQVRTDANFISRIVQWKIRI